MHCREGRGAFRARRLLGTILVVSVIVGVSVVPAQDRNKINAGSVIYAERCAACHGERLRATGVGFDLTKLKPEERERFDKAVNDGKGQMPPWAGVLNEDEIDQLWAYIRSRIDG